MNVLKFYMQKRNYYDTDVRLKLVAKSGFVIHLYINSCGDPAQIADFANPV